MKKKIGLVLLAIFGLFITSAVIRDMITLHRIAVEYRENEACAKQADSLMRVKDPTPYRLHF